MPTQRRKLANDEAVVDNSNQDYILDKSKRGGEDGPESDLEGVVGMPLPINMCGEEGPLVPLMLPLLQETIGFIYRNKTEALADANFQAVGFFVRIFSTSNPAWGFPYFVTNYHVLRDIGVSRFVVRVNTKTGVATTTVKSSDFVTNPKRDIAACSINMHGHDFQYAYITPLQMLRRWSDKSGEIWVGAGDDVVMPSRIVSKTKYKTKNTTVLRFGNVSLAPEDGDDSSGFIVEMRSIAGHSGSPVFYYDMGLHLSGIRAKTPKVHTLIGINRGHLAQYEEVVSATDIAAGKVGRKPPTHYVATNMAMSHVIPAWEILELLDDHKLKQRRTDAEERLKAQFVEDAMPSASQKSEDKHE